MDARSSTEHRRMLETNRLSGACGGDWLGWGSGRFLAGGIGSGLERITGGAVDHCQEPLQRHNAGDTVVFRNGVSGRLGAQEDAEAGVRSTAQSEAIVASE